MSRADASRLQDFACAVQAGHEATSAERRLFRPKSLSAFVDFASLRIWPATILSVVARQNAIGVGAGIFLYVHDHEAVFLFGMHDVDEHRSRARILHALAGSKVERHTRSCKFMSSLMWITRVDRETCMDKHILSTFGDSIPTS